MVKKVLLLTLIMSIGIFSWVPGQPQEKYQEPFIVVAAMKGIVEKRTSEYTVAPERRPDRSPPPAVAIRSPSPNNNNKEKKGVEGKKAPKPPPPPVTPR